MNSLLKKNRSKVKNKEENSKILNNLQPKIYEFISLFYSKIGMKNNLAELKLQLQKNKSQLIADTNNLKVNF